MTENQIAGKGFEGVIFLEYKDELIMEANKLRKENGVNAIILLSHIGIKCGNEDNLTLNMYKPSDIQEKCSQDSDLYTLINSLDEGIVDAVVTGHSHREVHHWVNNIPIISPINNGFYANIIYLAFDRKNNYNLVYDKVRIEGPLPVCEKIFLKNLKCEIVKPNELEDYLPLIEYKFHEVKIEKDPILEPIHIKYDDMEQAGYEFEKGRIKAQQEENYPKGTFSMVIDDLFEIAAWYGIALAKGHAFVDGNKRTGLAVMLTFLEIQGVTIKDHTGLDDLMVDIVEDQDEHEKLAQRVSDFLYELSEI